MNLVITGDVGAGKTSWCQDYDSKLVAAGISIGGIICPVIFDRGLKTGYNAIDLLTGVQAPFCLFDSQGSLSGQRVGRYRINDTGIAFAVEAINEAIGNGCRVVFIDEIGPLELSGGGLAPVARTAYESGLYTISVVRRSLLEAFFTVFVAPELRLSFKTHDLSSKSDEIIEPGLFLV